ncbi:MAG: hypothetical protein LBP93_00845, partial [Treponema sp.]|nr:hypothetical protein [Treponema sp.]
GRPSGFNRVVQKISFYRTKGSPNSAEKAKRGAFCPASGRVAAQVRRLHVYRNRGFPQYSGGLVFGTNFYAFILPGRL